MRSTCKHRHTVCKHKQTQAKATREWEERERRSLALQPAAKSTSLAISCSLWMPCGCQACVLSLSHTHQLRLECVDAKACLLLRAADLRCQEADCGCWRRVAVDVAACAACAALSANSWSAFRFQLVFHCGAARTCLGFARLCSARRSDLEFSYSLFLCSVSQ